MEGGKLPGNVDMGGSGEGGPDILVLRKHVLGGRARCQPRTWHRPSALQPQEEKEKQAHVQIGKNKNQETSPSGKSQRVRGLRELRSVRACVRD
eukprot:1282897-Rhodomonas_salina.1